MGDFGDLRLNQGDVDLPRSGSTCMRISYSGKMSQGAGWSGIYWQHPANNWGDKKGKAYDLTGAKALTFWARGARGGERIAEFKVGGIPGEYGDSDNAVLGPITLSKNWTKYSISLAHKDLSSIIGGFCFALSKDDTPDGIVMYLDDIVFE
jgi:hypothetical protein